MKIADEEMMPYQKIDFCHDEAYLKVRLALYGYFLP